MKIGKLRISVVRNDSFRDPKYAMANVGESIQSVAMEYIYDQCGVDRSDIIKIDQCDVKQYDGEEVILPLRLPLSHDTVDDYFPLHTCVHPFFISLHLHDDIFEDRQDLVDYFMRYAPIGCRDEISCGFFRKHGIESYVMGCYTLAFPKRTASPEKGKVFMVDASKTLEENIPTELLKSAVRLSHAVPYHKYPVTPDEDERLETLAREYVNRYRDEAVMMITSRLHVAAPSVAMGIPVVLASDNADFRYAWIDAFVPVYQADDYKTIDWAPKSVDISTVRKDLMDVFDGILNHQEMRIPALQSLDAFYRSRQKTQYYKLFRNRLAHIKEIYGGAVFTYAIWGAGNHSLFAYELMSEMYPEAKLVAVVDRFKTGSKFGVPIVHGEDIQMFRPDHICISTKPGFEDAITGCKQLYGDTYAQHYTAITSQQES